MCARSGSSLTRDSRRGTTWNQLKRLAAARTSHWKRVIVNSITEGAEGNEKEPTGKINVYVSFMKVIGCLYGYMKWLQRRRKTYITHLDFCSLLMAFVTSKLQNANKLQIRT